MGDVCEFIVKDWCRITILVIFMAIGLSCFLLGCDKTGVVPCALYDAYHGTVYSYSVTKRSCKDCKGCGSYDCWDVYQVAREKYNNVTGENFNTCRYVKYEGLKNKPNASSYSIGGDVNWMKKKNTTSCSDSSRLNIIWTVGVVFLALAFVVSLFIVRALINVILEDSDNKTGNNNYLKSPQVIEIMALPEPKTEIE